jgi:2-keto-4-pentenoate hydratase/2-oxohepta-3-ene-1,7-dioic acid hydratase in catechol pathway
MRWVTYRHDDEAADRVGLLLAEEVHGLQPGLALIDLLGDDGERLAMAGERARSEPVEVVRLEQVRLRPPVPNPPTFRDFYAFEQHVKVGRQRRGLEMEPDWYQLPVFYFSNPNAFVGTGEPVPVPPGCRELDFELEVAAVVGLGGANLSPEEAGRCLAGYCVLNDWSARDLQRREMKLNLGPAKGKDFATSLGPYFVTADELAPFRRGQAFDLAMTATVGGREYSRASLADIYWSFEELLAYASRGTRVVPGEVIASGTCGTGCILELSLVHGEAAYPWLAPGDEVVCSVEQLGDLINQVVPGPPEKPLRPLSSG